MSIISDWIETRESTREISQRLGVELHEWEIEDFKDRILHSMWMQKHSNVTNTHP